MGSDIDDRYFPNIEEDAREAEAFAMAQEAE